MAEQRCCGKCRHWDRIPKRPDYGSCRPFRLVLHRSVNCETFHERFTLETLRERYPELWQRTTCGRSLEEQKLCETARAQLLEVAGVEEESDP